MTMRHVVVILILVRVLPLTALALASPAVELRVDCAGRLIERNVETSRPTAESFLPTLL